MKKKLITIGCNHEQINDFCTEVKKVLHIPVETKQKEVFEIVSNLATEEEIIELVQVAPKRKRRRKGNRRRSDSRRRGFFRTRNIYQEQEYANATGDFSGLAYNGVADDF